MGTSKDERNRRRKEVVEAIVVRQEPVHLVRRVFNIPERTIFNWLSLYRSGGWDALKEGARSGRSRKLSGFDMKWIYHVVTSGTPEQHKFDFCLWTLGALRTLIKRDLGVELSVSAVSRTLGHLGLSAQRPVYKSYRQDPRKIKQYVAENFPQAVKQAEEMGATIFFLDEAAVRSDSHRGTTWGKKGETPEVSNSGGRFGLKLISAVTPRGDLRFQIIEGKMNSAKFTQFLSKLHRDAGKPILVITDNARYHHSKETQKFIQQQEEILLEFIPAYSPELNPDEQVWNHLKQRLSKRPVFNKDDMKSSVLSIMRSLQKQKKLIQSFFRLKDTRYVLKALAG